MILFFNFSKHQKPVSAWKKIVHTQPESRKRIITIAKLDKALAATKAAITPQETHLRNFDTGGQHPAARSFS